MQTDAKSVLFTKENVNDKLFKNIKKSKYEKDIEFVKLFDRNVNFLEDEKITIPIKTKFVEKKVILIDQLSLALMVLFSCYMLNLKFLGKSACDPKYSLLFVNLFTSKVYVYPMESRKHILNKMYFFYKEVEKRSKNKASN